MKKSISTRFSFATVLVSTLILVAVIFVNYSFIKKQLIQSANDKAKLEVIKSQSQINKILFNAIKSSQRAKILLQRENLKQEGITSILTSTLEKNENLYGMAVAMEPGVVYKEQFSPYFYKKGRHIVYANLATSSYNYLEQPWYLNVKNSKEAMWSEPYFDEGGGNILMATYSNPIFYDGKFAGVVTIDLALKKLKDIVSSIRILNSGYAFLLSAEHTVLVHPNDTLIMKKYENSIEYDKIIKEKNKWIYYTKIESTDWILGIVMPENELFSSLYQITVVSIFLALFGILILGLTIYIISKKIIKPLKDIIDMTDKISNGNFDITVEKPSSRDEVYQLFLSVTKMRDELKKYINNLKIATQKEERIRSELSIASKIQMDMLPVAQKCKDQYCIDLYASLEPAKAVGGDFYDFFHLGDDKLCFVIADVSGKGIPAALFMAVTISYIRAFSSKDLAPSEIVGKVNNALSINNGASMFVTMFFAILDLKSGEIVYVNAGHTKPYLFSSNKYPVKISTKNDPIVGVMEDLEFTDHSLKLEYGEKLFLYTDGVNEAFSASGEQFGEDRIAKELNYASKMDTSKILPYMNQVVKDFSVGVEQSDDITIFLVSCK